QVGRLIDIERIGTAVPDVTEGTAAGALITHNHEGCRALTKAFADVGARSFLANREHIVLAKNPLDIVETRSRRSRFDTYPFWFLQAFGLNDLDGQPGCFISRFLFGSGIILSRAHSRLARYDLLVRCGHMLPGNG